MGIKVSMIRVNVTQEHIDKGVRLDTRRCPIALAFAEQTGKECCVGISFIAVSGCSGYRIPEHARDFALRFDCSLPVHPFSFEVYKIE